MTRTNREDLQQMMSGTSRKITTVTEAYTAQLTDDVIIARGAAPFTITLPTAASAYDSATRTGKTLTFVNPDTDDCTIDGAGSETINGSTTLVLDVQYETTTIVSDGTEWLVI